MMLVSVLFLWGVIGGALMLERFGIASPLEQLAVRLSAVIQGGLMVGAATATMSRVSLTKRFVVYFDHAVAKSALVAIVVCAFATAIGIWSGHNLIYIVSDVYWFLLFPAGMLVIAPLFSSRNMGVLFKTIVVTLIVFLLIKDIEVVGKLIAGTGTRTYHYPVLSIVLLLFYLSNQDKISRIMKTGVIFTIIISCVALVLSLGRTNWGMLGIGVGVWVLEGRKAANAIRKIVEASLIVTVIVALLVAIFPVGRDVVHYGVRTIIERVEGMTGRNPADYSLNVKAAEAKIVWNELSKSPVYILWGKGFGAEYKVPTRYRELFGPRRKGSEAGWVHAIHNGYVNILFKTGLVGLVIYLQLFSYILFSLWRGIIAHSHRLSAKESIIIKTSLAYLLMCIFGSIFLKQLLGNIVLLILVVFSIVLLSRPRKEMIKAT